MRAQETIEGSREGDELSSRRQVQQYGFQDKKRPHAPRPPHLSLLLSLSPADGLDRRMRTAAMSAAAVLLPPALLASVRGAFSLRET
jgi:hypothetical protein